MSGPGRHRGAVDRSGQRQEQVVGLDQDRLLHACQRRTGIHAQVLHQADSSAPRSGQRVGLPVAAVQREHQPDPPALAERIGGDPRLQLGHQLVVPAEVEVDVDPRLQDRGLQIRQAPPLALGPAGGTPVLERLAVPVRQGGLEPAPRREQFAFGPGGRGRRRRHRDRAHADEWSARREPPRMTPEDLVEIELIKRLKYALRPLPRPEALGRDRRAASPPTPSRRTAAAATRSRAATRSSTS